MSLPPGIEDICDLTPLQQGMLFHSLYTPDTTVYLIQLALTLEGRLDLDLLDEAWQQLAQRHAALRCAFLWERMERPFQLVHKQVVLKPERMDWRDLDAAQQSRRLEEFLEEDRRKGFNLNKPPLMRLAHIDIGGGRSHLVWTFHHIILEGWSSSILLAELWRIYGALRAGNAPQLPASPSYVDYLRWIKAQDPVATENYWRQRLRGFNVPTRMPMGGSGSRGSDMPASVHAVDQCALTLPPALYEGLRNFARTQRITMNTVIQGVWAILLSRYTGERDVAFGAVVSGRPAEMPGSDAMVGLFVNTLPAYFKVDPAQALGEWLRALQLDQVEMRQYEYSSLMQIQSWSEVSGGQPLFDTVFAFENWLDAPQQAIADGAIRVVNRIVREESDQPLSVFVTGHDGLTLTLMYDIERFEQAAVARMLGHCRVLLEAMVANPATLLGDLPMLTAEEQAQLVGEWAGGIHDYPRDASIKQLFEAQAAKTPDAIALEHANGRLTYAELNARANQVAHTLIGCGAGPEVMVGLMAKRSEEMIVGLLGIVKSGAAYVPLDPDYPAARLQLMVEDTVPPVLLITEEFRNSVPAGAARVLALDTDSKVIATAPQDNPQVELNAHNLAYVMYTSGSTGRPKGACIEQRGVVRLVCNTNYVTLGPQTVITHYSPISFDAATFAIWGSLLNGGRLVLCPPGLLSMEELGQVIQKHGVNTLWITSALFQQLVNEQIDSLRGVRYVITGGEVASVAHMRRVLDEVDGVTLINVYGPTENTTFTTFHPLNKEEDYSEGGVPIGRPISSSKVYLLDEKMRPVPIGVAGELDTGGDGLGREYLHRPDLTAERFVPDPFAAEAAAGARLYRTGDLARYDEDGRIMFIGRRDHQVKLRGFRIELGEIDTALGRHPTVRESISIVREDSPGDRRLVSYINGNDAVKPDELRDYLRESLPDYMVPAHFIVLDGLPVDPNGKVDRAALPAPDGERRVGNAYVAPASEMESQIAAIWRQVLRLDQVGTDDNFFDLGGNSMLLVRVHGKLKPIVGDGVTVVDMFRFPTIRSLAQRLGQGNTASSDSSRFDEIRDRARRRREAGRGAAATR